MKYLIFDISSVLYRTFFQNKNQDVVTSTGLAHHMALMSMNKFYKEFKPKTGVVAAFDRHSWRKDYTNSEHCLSQKPYKSNRRRNMTPAQEAKFFAFKQHVDEFESILQEHTAIICLSCDGLEADDLIAGFVQAYGDEDEIAIISRDRDLAQLLDNNRVTQYDPTSGEPITVESAIKDLYKIKDKTKRIDEDLCCVDYFLFAKCLKGDTGDYVQSAYPGIRKGKVDKAYRNPYEYTNLMNETWKSKPNSDGDVVKYRVGDLVKEGNILMNLSSQPDSIRHKIFNTILERTENPGSFSYFHFMRFLGKYEMKEIAKNLETFAPLLNG